MTHKRLRKVTWPSPKLQPLAGKTKEAWAPWPQLPAARSSRPFPRRSWRGRGGRNSNPIPKLKFPSKRNERRLRSASLQKLKSDLAGEPPRHQVPPKSGGIPRSPGPMTTVRRLPRSPSAPPESARRIRPGFLLRWCWFLLLIARVDDGWRRLVQAGEEAAAAGEELEPLFDYKRVQPTINFRFDGTHPGRLPP